MTDKMAALRTLHAEYLEQKPLVEDLPDDLHDIAIACRKGEQEFLCQWAHDNLSNNGWDRIRAA